MKFQPGESGNPDGRAKGSQNKNTKLAKLLEPHAGAIVTKMVEMAKEGDISAIKLCIERMIPKVKDQYIAIKLPAHKLDTVDDLLKMGAFVLDAVAEGRLTPEQGQHVTSIITANCKIIETNELAARLAEIEYLLKKRKG